MLFLYALLIGMEAFLERERELEKEKRKEY